MLDETAGYTPPNADAAANTPAPQPWEQRHANMATIKRELFAANKGPEHPFHTQFNEQFQDLTNRYGTTLETLFSNSNWISNVASGQIRIGEREDRIALSVGDIEAHASRVAGMLNLLGRIDENVSSLFAEDPAYPQNLFRNMFYRGVIAMDAAHKAGLYQNNVVTSLSLSTQEQYLKKMYDRNAAAEPQEVDSMDEQQIQQVAYALHALGKFNTFYQEQLIDKNQQGSLSTRVPIAVGYFDRAASNEIAPWQLLGIDETAYNLPQTIRRSGHIRVDYTLHEADTADQTQASAEAGQDNAGEKSYVLLADENVASSERALSDIEYRIQETRAALEQLEAERVELTQHLNEAKSTRDEALNLESLQANAAKREELLRGYDEDVNASEARVRAATLYRPEDEGPGFANLEDFLGNVSELGIEQIAAIYDIDASQFEASYSQFQSLVQTVRNGVDFSLLRDPLVTLFDRIIEDIGPENLQRGRENLEKIIQSTDGIEELETRVRDGLAQGRNLPNE